MNDLTNLKLLELINTPMNSIGEVQEATEKIVKIKLNIERIKKFNFRPSIGDFVILEAEKEHPIALIYSTETQSNVPFTEYIGVSREERNKIYYEPPASFLNALIIGFYDKETGKFYQDLPSESILPDDQVFYLSSIREAVLRFHLDKKLNMSYLPRFFDLVDRKEVTKVLFKKLVKVFSKTGIRKEEFIEAILESFKTEGEVQRRISHLLSSLQLVEEVWK